MEVFEDEHERALPSGVQAELAKCFERPCFDRLGVRQRRLVGGILDLEQMEKDRGVLVGFHSDLFEPRADFFGNRFGGVGLEDPAIAAQHVESQPVGDAGAVGQAPPFDPAHPAVAQLPAELRQQPGFPDAGLADEPNRLAMPVLDLAKGAVQNRQLAVAVDKRRGGSGRGLVDGGAPMRNAEQAVRHDRLALALEGQRPDRLDPGIAPGQRPGGFTDQDRAGLGCLLEPRGDIGGVADHRVVARQFVGDRAEDDGSGMNADPHRHVQSLGIGLIAIGAERPLDR